MKKKHDDLLEQTAGGIMTTEFVRLTPEMTVGEALQHIRGLARDKESIYACYVLEAGTGRHAATHAALRAAGRSS